MKYGSLFTGLGLLDEGVRRATGGQLAWFSELSHVDVEAAVAQLALDRDTLDDEQLAARKREIAKMRSAAWARDQVAARHPNARALGSVLNVDGSTLEPVDLLAFGFPCQDISQAGSGEGLSGAKSGLWSEAARIIREMPTRPPVLVIENSSMLPSRGLNVVLGDLATLGYTCAWQVIGAAGVGAPHLRERTAIVGRLDGYLPTWGPLRPWRDQLLNEYWNSEREPAERVIGPLRSRALKSWRVAAVRALGNGVVVPWAEYVTRAATTPRRVARDLLGYVDGKPLRGQKLGPAGIMVGGRFYAQRRVYKRSRAEREVKASALCRLYAAQLLPTPTARDERAGCATDAVMRRKSLPLNEYAVAQERGRLVPTPVAASATRGSKTYKGGNPTLSALAGKMLPTPTARDCASDSVTDSDRASRGGESSFRKLPEVIVAAERGRVLPTPTASSYGNNRGGAAGRVGPVRPSLQSAGRLLATPTTKGNHNRAGLSERSGDGLATQAGAMSGGATLLNPVWVAWLMGAPAEWFTDFEAALAEDQGEPTEGAA